MGVAVEQLDMHTIGRVLKVSAEFAGFAMPNAAQVVALLDAAIFQLGDDGVKVFIGDAECEMAAVEVGLGRRR